MCECLSPAFHFSTCLSVCSSPLCVSCLWWGPLALICGWTFAFLPILHQPQIKGLFLFSFSLFISLQHYEPLISSLCLWWLFCSLSTVLFRKQPERQEEKYEQEQELQFKSEQRWHRSMFSFYFSFSFSFFFSVLLNHSAAVLISIHYFNCTVWQHDVVLSTGNVVECSLKSFRFKVFKIAWKVSGNVMGKNIYFGLHSMPV